LHLTGMNSRVLSFTRGSNGQNQKHQKKEDEGTEEPSCHSSHGFRTEVEKTAPAAHGPNEAEPYKFACKSLTTNPAQWRGANLGALGNFASATSSPGAQFRRHDGSAAAVCETLATQLVSTCASQPTMNEADILPVASGDLIARPRRIVSHILNLLSTARSSARTFPGSRVVTASEEPPANP